MNGPWEVYKSWGDPLWLLEFPCPPDPLCSKNMKTFKRPTYQYLIRPLAHVGPSWAHGDPERPYRSFNGLFKGVLKVF